MVEIRPLMLKLTDPLLFLNFIEVIDLQRYTSFRCTT